MGAVKELLKAGANVVATDGRGYSPLQVAQASWGSGWQATVEVLQAAELHSPEAKVRDLMHGHVHLRFLP